MNPATLCATTAPAPTRDSSAASWPDLTWVDEFIRRVRPYIQVRATDGLLIKRPNQAQKLNPTGVRVLTALLAGDSFDRLVERVGRDPVKIGRAHV